MLSFSRNDFNVDRIIWLAFNLTENKTERPGSCAACFSPQIDARRRVRSSGMIKRKFDLNKNNDTYYTSSNQYLVSRNRTFQQNQYNYIRQGDTSVKPGSALSRNNLYSAGGLSHCKQQMISAANNNNIFTYTWYNNVVWYIIVYYIILYYIIFAYI